MIRSRLDVVFDAVERHTGVAKRQILEPTQGSYNVNEARYIAITMTKRGLGFSYKQTAKAFKRDVSSVRYAMRKVLQERGTLIKAIKIQADVIEVMK